MAEKRTKKTKTSHKGTLVLIMLLMILSAAFYYVCEYVCADNILVEGNKLISDEEIITLSGVVKGEPAIKIDIAAAKKSINENPYLEYDKISITLPDTITIHVKEKAPAAALVYADKQVVISSDSDVLEIREAGTDAAYPLIIGITPSSFEVGGKLLADDAFQIEVIQSVLDELYKFEIADKIDTVNLDDINAIMMHTTDNRDVKLGSAENLSKKMAILKSVFQELDELGKTGGTIDVTTGEYAAYLPSSGE